MEYIESVICFLSATIYDKLTPHSITWHQMLVSEHFLWVWVIEHGTRLIPDTNIDTDAVL